MFRTFAVVALAALAQIMMSSAGFAQDATVQKIEDEARLKLAEEHIDGLEDAMKQIARLANEQKLASREMINLTIEKRAKAEALSRILSGYFWATRLQPVDSVDALESYFKQVRLLHRMIVLAGKCKDGNDLKFCNRLRSLNKELRQAYLGDSDQPAAPPTDDGTAAEPEEPAGADVLSKMDDMEREIVESCNFYRKGRGLSPLELDGKLCVASKEHSEDMNRQSYFSHRSPLPGKGHFQDRARVAGTTASAENIARQCVGAEMAMQLWLKSSGHQANIVGPYSRVGVGRGEGFYTLMLGK